MLSNHTRKKVEANTSLIHSAIKGALWGLMILTLGLGALWWYFPWEPTVSASVVQSFLIGIVQVQAGILAVAVSFSVLYLQVSLESYSLRASDLFLKKTDFPRLIRDFIFTLAINSVLALLVSDTPNFLPVLFSFIGGSLFLASLMILLRYINQVAESVSPEKIVAETLTDSPYSKLSAEAVEFLYPTSTDLYKTNLKIQVPGLFGSATQLGPSMKILVDIARRMIDQFDHAVLNQILNGITGRNKRFTVTRIPEQVSENEIWIYRSNTQKDDLTDDKVKENIIAEKKIIYEAVYLAYLVGGILQILPAAIRANNKPAVKTIIAAIGKVLNGCLFLDSFYKTDILQSALTDNLLHDLELEGWLDLKLDALEMFIDCLQISQFSNPSKFNDHTSSQYFRMDDPNRVLYGYERTLFAFLTGLFDKNKMDTELGRKIGLLCLNGIYAITTYGAAKGSAMVGDFALVLGSIGNNVEIHYRTVSRYVELIGKWWAVAAFQGPVYASAYSTLMRRGVLNFCNSSRL